MIVASLSVRARLLRAWILVLICGGVAPSAFAQTPTADPDGGSVFGGADRATGPQSLNATVSISTAHDDNLAGDQGSVSPLQSGVGGRYSNLDVALRFAQRRRRTVVNADAATSLRQYPGLDQIRSSNHSADIGLTSALGRRTSIRARIDGRYTSSFAFETFVRQPNVEADIESSSGLQGAPADWTITTYGAGTELTRTLGRRASVAVSYEARRSERLLVGEHNREQSAVLQFARSAGRDTSFRAFYTFRLGAQRTMDGFRRRVVSHDAQFGIGHQWRHSAARRTVLSLAAGPTLRDEPSLLQTGETGETGRLVSAVGSISISHDLSRSWTAAISYRRGAGFSGGVVPSNAATVDVHGTAGRRVDLAVSAGYTDGEIGLNTLDNRYATSFGSAAIQVALTRIVAVHGQYFVYRYDFGTVTSLAAGLSPRVNREAVRVGVTLWLPILGR